jgi:predicted DNA-binding transcriptional regulator AlpA
MAMRSPQLPDAIPADLSDAPPTCERATTLLRVKDLERLMGVGIKVINNLIKDHGFPRPLDLGHRTLRWNAIEYNDWLERYAAHQRGETRKGPATTQRG